MTHFSEILAKIDSTAKAHGFSVEYEQRGHLPRITTNEKTSYVTICLSDVPDFQKCDYAKGHIVGHVEVTASISRMGGNPTPEELINAAEQIKEAALLVQELQGSDLAYSEIRREQNAA